MDNISEVADLMGNGKENSYVLSLGQFKDLKKKALYAQKLDQSEICGIVTEEDSRLTLHYLRNESLKPGNFALSNHVINQKLISLGIDKAFSSFHSHPITEAIPSRGDLQKGFLNGVCLIYDVCGEEARLWKKNNDDSFFELELAIC